MMSFEHGPETHHERSKWANVFPEAFSESVAIDASVEHVWAILSDVERWPEWTPTVTRAERLDKGAIGVGSRTRLHQPKMRPMVWEITHWWANVAFIWVSAGPGFHVTAEHLLERAGSGCRVTLELRYRGLIGQLAGVITATLTRRYLHLEATGLKQRSEAVNQMCRLPTSFSRHAR